VFAQVPQKAAEFEAYCNIRAFPVAIFIVA